MIPTDCDALHYTCALCGHHTCAEERPSPCEAHRLCDDCAPLFCEGEPCAA